MSASPRCVPRALKPDLSNNGGRPTPSVVFACDSPFPPIWRDFPFDNFSSDSQTSIRGSGSRSGNCRFPVALTGDAQGVYLRRSFRHSVEFVPAYALTSHSPRAGAETPVGSFRRCRELWRGGNCHRRARLQQGIAQTIPQHNHKDRAIEKRQPVIGLNQPVVMHDAA
jgi:hypothetical protein